MKQPAAAALILTLSSISLLHAENWPQFRGSQAGVAADDPRLPETWSQTENVVWKVNVPGIGWSSPVVWNDHVIVTSAVTATDAEKPKPGLYLGTYITEPKGEYKWIVSDYDLRTGQRRWEREVKAAVPGGAKHLKNSYASETPVTDGERVYVYFGNVGLFVFDLNGKPLWSKPMGPFRIRNGWGTASSPVVHRDRVYLVVDNDDRSFMMAYNKVTGSELWRVERQEGTNWTTPFVWEHDKRTEIITAGSDKTRAYDVDGKLLWELSGMSTIAIPTPFARHGLLYISSGYVADQLRPTYAIRPGASGDISLKAGETSNAFIAWSNPTAGPYNPTPLVYGDYLYTLHDRGFLTCHDAKTGKEIYGRQRISAESTGFTSSPWAYNGKVFLLSEDGDTFVVQAGPEFKVLGKNSLGELTLATPAVAGRSLVVRTASTLFRIARP
ncbi:MAG: serine/threonine protein kinase [Acidimicrobiia bacterium]|nr:serine/threonine protein kinase [Acidimicrobiia bacterium]